MEAILHVSPEINAVLLINGSFVERADNVRVELDQALYITLLPLSAVYLPYTVKLVSGKPIDNEALCSCYSVKPGHLLVRLKGRSNYVYSPVSAPPSRPEVGLVPRFFRLIQEGAFAAARGCMTKELSSTVTDDALAAFFADYTDIAENVFTPQGGWFALSDGGGGAHFNIVLRSGLIDNMEEMV